MPPLTRWFIKTSLAYCVCALIVDFALMLRLSLDLPPIVGALQPAYFHLMLGWIAQLIFGVAYWMFPKFTIAQPRGDERLGWATYGLLNAGLLLRVIRRAACRGAAWGRHRLGARALGRSAGVGGVVVRSQPLAARQGALTCRA